MGLDCVFASAQICDLEGRTREADTLLERLEELAWDTDNLATLRLLASFRAQRAARMGNRSEAKRWLIEAQPTAEGGPMLFFEVPELTQVKVLLGAETRESAREALEHLAHLEDVALSFSNRRRLVEILALSALTCARLGDKAEVARQLEQAVELGERGGFVRTFLDLGPEMARLLADLEKRGPATEYVSYLLRQFAVSPSLHVADDRAAVHREAARSQLVEPLSAREMEVLALLVKRQSYQEIGQVLLITRATVCAHINHIYRKLNVNSRRETIDVVQRLDLLQVS